MLRKANAYYRQNVVTRYTRGIASRVAIRKHVRKVHRHSVRRTTYRSLLINPIYLNRVSREKRFKVAIYCLDRGRRELRLATRTRDARCKADANSTTYLRSRDFCQLNLQ